MSTEKVVHLGVKSAKANRSRLDRLPVAMHDFHDKFKLLVSEKLKLFFDHVDDSLFNLADRAQSNYEQNLFFDSMREVRVQRRSIEKQFVQSIDDAFMQLVHRQEDKIEENEIVSIDALSLVRNDDLEEMVAMDASIVRANTALGVYVQQMSLRLDTLVPTKVYEKNNPVGPEVLCSAFMKHTKTLDIDIKAKLVLFKLFDHHVMAKLGEIYPIINQVLIDHGILPKLSTEKLQGEKNPEYGRRQSDAHLNSVSGHCDDLSSSMNEEVVTALKNLLGEQAFSKKSSDVKNTSNIVNNENTSNGHLLDNVDNQLIELLSLAQQQIKNQDQSSSSIDVQNLLNKIQKEKDVKTNIDQVDGEVINLVAMLFDFILDDRNLAAPMKALLARLQIPLVKVAVVDKTFFTKSGHPARRLLNEMASAALGWHGNEDTTEKDPLYRKIYSIIVDVVEKFDTDVSIFSEHLTDFSSYLQKEEKRRTVLEKRTLDAEDGKAKAAVARNLVKDIIDSCINKKSLPPAALKIIEGPWCNFLFVTGLKYGFDSEQVEEGLATLDDLIWSALPVNPEDRKKLIKLIPSLLKELRKGMDSIAFNPYEMSDLFKALEEVHLARIRSNKLPTDKLNEKISNDNVTSIENVLIQPKTSSDNKDSSVAITDRESRQLKVTNLSDLKQSELEPNSANAQMSNPKEISSDIQSITPAHSKTKNIDDSFSEDDPAMLEVKRFVQGAWFEMKDNSEHDIRCRLAAFIKPTGKYIFVNRGGMKVAEKSQIELALLLRNDRLKVLDNSMLFDRALETIVSGLRRT